jgi:hypothetical protein
MDNTEFFLLLFFLGALSWLYLDKRRFQLLVRISWGGALIVMAVGGPLAVFRSVQRGEYDAAAAFLLVSLIAYVPIYYVVEDYLAQRRRK